MVLTHIFTRTKNALYKSTSLWLGLLVVGLYLFILEACLFNQHDNHQTQLEITKLKPIQHVTLQAAPVKNASAYRIIQTGGTSPTKFLTFDDFMKSYSSSSEQSATGFNQTAPPKSGITNTQTPLAVPSFELTSSPNKASTQVNTVSTPVVRETGPDDFSAFMKSQPGDNKFTPEQLPQESAELLIKSLKTETTPSASGNFEQNQFLPSAAIKENPNTPKLLIAETAQSLDLPKQVVNEIVREESTSPNGLQPQQVRKLIAMMINEAAELRDADQKSAATRLAKFAIFVADEASLTAVINDPELTSLLYLGRSLAAVSNDEPSMKPLKSQPVMESITDNLMPPLVKTILPEITPHVSPQITQQAKANEAMVLPGYAPPIHTSNIQHPVNQPAKTNLFQSAAYSNERSSINQAKESFQPFETAPHSTNKIPSINKPTSTTGYLAFPDSEAPIPPPENMLPATDVFSQEIRPSEKGIQVQDHLVEIPEHVSYGIMLGMFFMIILLLFRRK